MKQWEQLGRIVRAVHECPGPEGIDGVLVGDQTMEKIRGSAVQNDEFGLAMAEQLQRIEKVYERYLRLAEACGSSQARRCLCHGDLHLGNVMLAEDGDVWVVDWDFARNEPAELDLMFFVDGQAWNGPRGAELDAFWKSYGPHELDGLQLAYYRHERTLDDLAAFVEDWKAGERELSLKIARRLFEPGELGAVALDSSVSQQTIFG
jgi:spectinomycin phosphotransferase